MLCPLYRGSYNGLASSDQFIGGCRADYRTFRQVEINHFGVAVYDQQQRSILHPSANARHLSSAVRQHAEALLEIVSVFCQTS